MSECRRSVRCSYIDSWFDSLNRKLLSGFIAPALLVAVSVFGVLGCEQSRPTGERIGKYEVSGFTATSFDEKFVAEIRNLPEVQAVAPFIRRVTFIEFKGKKHRAMLLAVNSSHDTDVGEFTLNEGKLSDKQEGALLELGFAKSARISVNDDIKFMTRLGYVNTKVIGTFEYSKAEGRGFDRPNMIVPLIAAQQLYLAQGKVDFATVVLKPDSDARSAQIAIDKVLPESVVLSPIIERRTNAPDAIGSVHRTAIKK